MAFEVDEDAVSTTLVSACSPALDGEDQSGQQDAVDTGVEERGDLGQEWFGLCHREGHGDAPCFLGLVLGGIQRSGPDRGGGSVQDFRQVGSSALRVEVAAFFGQMFDSVFE